MTFENDDCYDYADDSIDDAALAEAIERYEREQRRIADNATLLRLHGGAGLTESEIIEILNEDAGALQYVARKTVEMRLLALSHDGNAIQYIDRPSEDEKMAAVRTDPCAIRYIDKPSIALQLEAVLLNSAAFEFIEHPSPKVKLKAVRRDGLLIRLCGRKPSRNLRMTAVSQNGLAVQYINEPTTREVLAALDQDPDTRHLVRNLKSRLKDQLAAVRQSRGAIQMFAKQHPEARLEVLRLDCDARLMLRPLTRREQLAYCVGYACKYTNCQIEVSNLPEDLKRDPYARSIIQGTIDEKVRERSGKGEIIDACLKLL